MARAHNHYFKNVTTLDDVDVYRVLTLFAVTDPCIQHAVKKLLVAGGRGAGKDITRDIQEAIDSLERWKEMRVEDRIAVEYEEKMRNAPAPTVEIQSTLRKPDSILGYTDRPPRDDDLCTCGHARVQHTTYPRECGLVACPCGEFVFDVNNVKNFDGRPGAL